MSDIEKGISAEEHNAALKNASSNGEHVRLLKRKEGDLSKAMDMIRQLVLVGTVVLVVLLIIGSFTDHPAVNVKHKYFALGGLVVMCSGYAVSLWLVRGQPVILLLLVVLGIGTLMFALGWTVSELRK